MRRFSAPTLSLTPEPRNAYAAYVASWLKALKDDKRFLFQAASYAQRAVGLLHGFQPLIERGRRGRLKRPRRP
ncbi:zincin-like metallopeptidase domain-containing protein [Acuticoccus sediminis]|uniref:zincin-like metallopeptidase domain-containing protein n=1 Tax=Acuticoccus sediminis TaxID=2184697 RepID=UPI00314530DC